MLCTNNILNSLTHANLKAMYTCVVAIKECSVIDDVNFYTSINSRAF